MKKLYKGLTVLTLTLFATTQLANAQLKQIGTAVGTDGTNYLVFEDNTADQTISTVGAISLKTYSGPSDKVQFQAKGEYIKILINYYGGPLRLATSTDGINFGNEIWSKEPVRGTYNTYSVSIARNTNKLKFYTTAGATGKHIFQNVKVTMAKYIEFAGGATSTNLAIPTNVIHQEGANAMQNAITFDWCNVNDLKVSCDNANFEVVPLNEYSRVGAWGNTTLTIRCLHKAVGQHTGKVTIHSPSLNKTLTINVSSETTKKVPTFTWTIPTTMSIEEVKENVVSATSGSGELTLVAADPNILLVEGLKVTAIGVGTTTLTASVAGSDEFYAADSTITITVDNKLRQTITWEQNLAVVPIGTTPITLEAFVNSNLPLVYSSSNPDVASVEGNVLTVKGVGRTNITVHQVGDDFYFPAYLTKTMVVYDPAVACPNMLLYGGNFSLSRGSGDFGSDIKEVTWDTSKPVDTVRFSVKGTKAVDIYIDAYKNSTKIDGWKKVAVSTSKEETHTYTIDEGITKLEFRLNWQAFGSGTVTFNNVEIPQVSYLASNVDSVVFNPINLNAVDTKDITLNFSALASMCGVYLEKEDKVFSIAEGITFGEGCGSVGYKTFAVKFSSQGLLTEDCGTYNNALLIINSQSKVEKRIPIIGKVEQLAQVIDWTPENTAINPLAEISVPTLTSAGLPIVYTSSDSTVAYVNEAYALVIVKHGVVTITANAVGDNTYQAAKAVAHTFTINPLSYEVSIEPIAAVEAGTALADIALEGIATDEASNIVEGQLTWADATIVPTAGTTAEYDVIFTPANTNCYVASNHQVSVSVNKQSQTITWAPTTSLHTIDTIVLPVATNSGLPIVYTSSDSTVAYVNDTYAFVILKAGQATITATAEGNDTYAAAEPVSHTFTISLSTLTLTVDALPVLDYDTPIGTLTITGTAKDAKGTNVAGQFAFAAPETIPTAGTTADYDVVFTPDNTNYYAVTNHQVTISVNKRNQTIVWEQATAITTLDHVTLSATSDAGLSITYTSLNEDIATIVDGTLHILQAGDVTIKAEAADNAEYNAAPAVEKTFAIALSKVILTPNPLADVWVGTKLGDITPTGVATDTTGAEVLGTWVFVAPETILSAGTAIHQLTFIPTNANIYASAQTEVSLTVNKKTQTIAWMPTTISIHTIDAITLPAASDSGLPIVYTSSDSTVAYVNDVYALVILKAGQVTITANAEGNDTYAVAEPVSHTFTISLSTLTITVDALPELEHDTPIGTLTITGTATDAKGTDVAGQFTFATPDAVPAAGETSEHEVIFTPTNGDYYAVATTMVSVTVKAAPLAQTITWEQTFTDVKTIDEIILLATSSADLPVMFTVTSEDNVASLGEENTLLIHTAGSVTITATAAGDEAYLAAEPITKTFTIRKTTYEIAYQFEELKITLGDALSTLGDLLVIATDEAGNTITGVMAFDEPAFVPTEVGTFAYPATFTPDNTDYYDTTSCEISVMVEDKKDDPTTDIEMTESTTNSVRKVLKDGAIYILRNGEVYTITGVKI